MSGNALLDIPVTHETPAQAESKLANCTETSQQPHGSPGFNECDDNALQELPIFTHETPAQAESKLANCTETSQQASHDSPAFIECDDNALQELPTLIHETSAQAESKLDCTESNQPSHGSADSSESDENALSNVTHDTPSQAESKLTGYTEPNQFSHVSPGSIEYNDNALQELPILTNGTPAQLKSKLVNCMESNEPFHESPHSSESDVLMPQGMFLCTYLFHNTLIINSNICLLFIIECHNDAIQGVLYTEQSKSVFHETKKKKMCIKMY